MKIIQVPEEKYLQLERRVARLEASSGAPNAKCITKKQAAEWLECTVATVNKYIKDGLLRCDFPSLQKCLYRRDVEKLMRSK